MPCVINIGIRPTVNSGSDVRVEAHVYDAPGQSLDLYGESVELEFTKRLRDEKRFENLEALKAQISKDIESARA
jgi:riboflavin kinase/FMN adenylyltransferase